MIGLSLRSSLNSLLNGTLRRPYLQQVSASELTLFAQRSQTWAIRHSLESLLEGEKISFSQGLSGTVDSASDADKIFQQGISSELQRQIYTIEPATQKCLDDVNAKRMREGKPPVDFLQTTREIEQIMDDSSLSDKEKKKKIDQIRKKLGLGKGDIKALFTKRLGKIYGEAARRIQDHLNQLKDAVKQAEKLHGKDSPQAAQARERLAGVQSTLQPALNELQHKSGLYNSLYPSFWSKFSGIFKSIGKALLKVGKVFTRIMDFVSPFLRLIPGIGQMISFCWGALKSLVSLARGNWMGFLGNLFSFANIPGLQGIFGCVSKFASKIFSAGKGLLQAFQGNLGGIFRMRLNGAEVIPPVGDFFQRTAGYLRRLISPLREVFVTRT